jgi:signal peptidase
LRKKGFNLRIWKGIEKREKSGEKMQGEQEKQIEKLKEALDKGKEKSRKKFFSSWRWYLIKYLLIWFILLIIFFSGILIYTGNWPSMMIVESDSMQHSDDEAFLGVMDTGDMVLIKSIEGKNDVVSYMKGKRTGHETYDEYGDVLIYRKNGYKDKTPVIHRAIIWLEYNETSHSFDLPELKYHDAGDDEEWYVVGGEDRWYNLTRTVVLREIGYDQEDVVLNLNGILNDFYSQSAEPHSGFITLGDHNGGFYDQGRLFDEHGGYVLPIKPEWIEGKARGELPGLGLTYLQDQDPEIMERAPSNSWSMFYLSVGFIILVFFGIPISIFIIEILLKKRRVKKKEEIGEEEGEEALHPKEEPEESIKESSSREKLE